MKNLKLFFLVFIFLGSSFAVFAIGEQEAEQEKVTGPVSLEWYTRSWTPQEVKARESLMAQWEKEHPNIVIKTIKGSSGAASREYLITNGLINQIADVFDGWHFYSNEFGPRGYFIDLSSYITRDAREDTFPFLWEAVSYKGKVYMMPYMSQVNMIFYRKDRYEEAGLKAAPIGSYYSWEEFRDASLKLTKVPDQWGIAASIPKEWAHTILCMFLWSAGSEYMAEERGEWRVKFGAEGRKALTYINDLFNKDKVAPPASMEIGSTGLRNGFLQGDFSQIIGQEYYIGLLNAQGGSDFQWDRQWRAQAMPVDKSRKLSLPRTCGFAIAENSKNKDAAWMFVDFMTSADAQKIWFYPDPQEGGQIPARRSAMEDDQYSLEKYDWPLIRYLIFDEGYHHNLPIHPAYGQFGSQVFGLGVHNILLGNMTVDQAIEFMEVEGNKLIQEYKPYE
jgi:ABC-type glycerol-3-phosphate transport system substrate-binding protein